MLCYVLQSFCNIRTGFEVEECQVRTQNLCFTGLMKKVELAEFGLPNVSIKDQLESAGGHHEPNKLFKSGESFFQTHSVSQYEKTLTLLLSKTYTYSCF